MNEYRVTKYNPNDRNEHGHYIPQDEWTEFSDVGTSVSIKEYETIEAAYISAAIQFAKSWGSSPIILSGMEDYSHNTTLKNDQTVTLTDLPSILRCILRSEFWCRIESSAGFIHFGYDYYMYLGSTEISTQTFDVIRESGLFVEKMSSPHHIEVS